MPSTKQKTANGVSRVRLEVAHQEPHREVGGRGRAERGDERRAAHAVSVGAQEHRDLQHGRGADDRRREQEREPGRVLVREPDQEAAAHRRARAREARDERDRLGGAHADRLPPAGALGDVAVAVGVAVGLARCAPPQPLGAVEHDAVQDQEERRRLGRREHRLQLVLQQQPEDAGRDRADDDQPAQPAVGVLGRDLALGERPPHARDDAHPVAPEEPEQHDRRRQVRRHEEGDEVVVVLVDVPPEHARRDRRSDPGSRSGTARRRPAAGRARSAWPYEIGPARISTVCPLGQVGRAASSVVGVAAPVAAARGVRLVRAVDDLELLERAARSPPRRR